MLLVKIHQIQLFINMNTSLKGLEIAFYGIAQMDLAKIISISLPFFSKFVHRSKVLLRMLAKNIDDLTKEGFLDKPEKVQ